MKEKKCVKTVYYIRMHLTAMRFFCASFILCKRWYKIVIVDLADKRWFSKISFTDKFMKSKFISK